MRRLRLVFMESVMAGAACLLLAPPVLAAGGQGNNTYSFDLATVNISTASSSGTMGSGSMTMPVMAGDSMSVTGSGTFNPTTRTATGKGTFVHHDSSGAIVCQGTWAATNFVSFTLFGTNQAGGSGGVLSILVTHYCQTMGMTMTGMPMTVTSTVDAPADSTAIEGTTVCTMFTPTRGSVVIQRQQ